MSPLTLPALLAAPALAGIEGLGSLLILADQAAMLLLLLLTMVAAVLAVAAAVKQHPGKAAVALLLTLLGLSQLALGLKRHRARVGPQLIRLALDDDNHGALEALAEGADPDVRDAHERTLLFHLCGQPDLALANMAIRYGADVHARDLGGRTALHDMARAPCGPTAAALLEAGADVNARDNRGDTPLHTACGLFGGDIATVTLLLDVGATIDAQNERGRTPLHGAVLHAHRDVLPLLLERGADTTLRDSGDQQPIDMARRQSDSEIVTALEAAMGPDAP